MPLTLTGRINAVGASVVGLVLQLPGALELQDAGVVAQHPAAEVLLCPEPSITPALKVELEPEQQPPAEPLLPAPIKTPALRVEFDPEQQPPDGVLLQAFSNSSGKVMSEMYLNMSDSLTNPFFLDFTLSI